MKSLILAATLAMSPALAFGQSTAMDGSDMPMDGSMMMSGVMASGMTPATEPGQGAFAAIAEIVAALESDPETDWSRVNISTLREHLRDMNVVMIDAVATAEKTDGGLRFTITGTKAVSPSITRMVLGHAGTMQGVNDWQYEAEAIDDGAILTVQVPVQDQEKLEALGFFGMLTAGVHHQPHHWMMATGG